LIDENILSKRIMNEIAVSFFINQTSGIIDCLTFKTIDRTKQDKSDFSSKNIEKAYIRI
jgi:hypothetical protein